MRHTGWVKKRPPLEAYRHPHAIHAVRNACFTLARAPRRSVIGLVLRTGNPVDLQEAFLDSGCTQPIVGALHGGCDSPTPFLVTDSGPNGYATYKRPAQTVAVPRTIYMKSSGDCVAYPSCVSSYDYYAAPLELVSPTELPKVVSQRIVRPGDA